MAIVIAVISMAVLAAIINLISGRQYELDRPDNGNKFFCAYATLVWVALSGLRHVSIGDDTITYGAIFLRVQNLSWQSLWDVLYDKYILDIFSKDPGYALFQKAVSYISGDYRVLLIIIALIFFVPMGIWIYRNSRMPFVSFLLFSCLFYSFFAITGHRQTIATALVVFVGDRYIRERKLGKFLLLTALASTIHASCLCYIVAYFVYPIRIYRQTEYLVLSFFGVCITLLFSQPLWEIIATELHYISFLENTFGGATTFGLLFFMVYLVAIWRMPVIMRSRPDAYGMYNILFVAAMMVAMAMKNQSFMRVQQYFTLQLMLVLPEIIRSFRDRDSTLVGLAGCSLLFVMFLKNVPYYKFFWQ